MNKYNKLIKEICDELGIKVTFLTCDGWLKVLEYKGKIKFVQGYKFPLNDHGLGSLIDDKELFYEVLTYKKLPIIEHVPLFHDYDREMVIDYFNSHNKEIIIKGNQGYCGREVFKVNDLDELFPVIDKLMLSQYSISMCPYYDIINEYRVIVLDGKARLVYGKIRPLVIGDGKSNLLELAIKFNPFYQENQDLIKNPDYVPKVGEEVLINYQFNLSQGAKIFTDIDDDLKNKIISLALKVSSSLDLKFGSVDIIYTSDHQLLVLESNSGVMMMNFMELNKDGYNLAKNLYKDAIKLMFTL